MYVGAVCKCWLHMPIGQYSKRITENKISTVCIISVKVGTVCNWREDVIVYTDIESSGYVQVVVRISR